MPRPWLDGYATMRRDVRTVALGLLGQSLPPLVTRPQRRRLAAAIVGRELRIARVVRETPDAVTLDLVDPTGAPIAYEAGQFFTALVEVGGQTLRRAYSASSSPLDGPGVSLTVKRVLGGRASSRLVDDARAGDLLRVLGPSGSFTVPPPDGAPRHLVLIAGGSGITPLLAIARDALARDPAARVSLVYGNRAERDVIFREPLAQLERDHATRLTVRHVLAEPPPGFAGTTGLLDRANVARELDALGVEADALHFVCGPEPMMIEARAALDARGVARDRVRAERFTQPHLRAGAELRLPDAPQSLRFLHRGVEREVVAPPGRTLLEAGLDAGVAMPFSCTMGGCGACRVRLAAGGVMMEEPNCLGEDERAAGWVLGCVARPTEPCTVEVP